MNQPATRLFEFEDFILNPGEKTLSRHTHLVALTPKAWEVLFALVEKSGHVVSKDDLIARVWPDTFIEEATLSQNIFILRRTLGDTPEGKRFIETVPRRGFRFVAPVNVRPEAEPLPGPPRAAGRIMLAVLPFLNYSGDPQQEFFSDGLTEEMITQLGRMHPQKLGVIARTSAMKYKDTKKSVLEIGRELGVDYVLEGSARHAGGRVRISAQLIQVRDQTHLWAENYDRELRDLLAVQDDVAQAIARQIHMKLTPQQEARLEKRAPLNPEVYELYLRGRYHWSRRHPEHLVKAIQCFESAVGLDPLYAAAHAGLAHCHVIESLICNVPPAQTFPAAKAAALRALELDDSLAEAQASLALALCWYDWDWAGSDRAFRRAIELNPNNVEAHHWYGFFLGLMGWPDEGIAEIELARRLDPLSIMIATNVGHVHFQAHRFEQAIRHLKKASEMEPDFYWPHRFLGVSYAELGEFKLGIAEAQKACELSGNRWDDRAFLGYVLGAAGRRQEARAVLQELSQRSKREYVSPSHIAMVCAGLRESDEALRWLEKAVEDRSTQLPGLQAEPYWRNLQSDPRFQELKRRVGFTAWPVLAAHA